MALEQGSEEGGLSKAYKADSSLPWQPVLSLLDRQSQPGITSDLRRGATTLAEGIVGLVARRLVQAQRSAPGAGPSTGGQGPSSKVRIIPH